MPQTTIDVTTIDDERVAYEVEQYLIGLPSVRDASADFLDDTVEVVHDGNITHTRLLDEIEHAGCTPCERSSGILGAVRSRILP